MSNMDQKVGYPKILMLRGAAPSDPDLLATLQSCFDITFADNLEDALGLIRNGRFDAVLSPTNDLLSLEHESVSQQAVAILNTIGEGVCIVAPDGRDVRKTFVQVVVRPLFKFCTEILMPNGAWGM